MVNLKLVSLNVRGMRGDKRYVIFKWLKDNQFDICLLQETYCTDSFKQKFDKDWEGKTFHATSDSSHSRGVCILFRNSMEYRVISMFTCNTGRCILVNVEINGDEYTFVNIYAPNNVKDRISFLKKVEDMIESNAVSKTNLLIAGDFNSVASTIDKTNGQLDKSSDTLKEMLRSLSLTDVWRDRNPGKIQFTFIDPSFHLRHS